MELVELARTQLRTDLVAAAGADTAEVVGTPVRVATALFAHSEPWTLPLRLREHLRGWFTVLDLEESSALEITPSEG